MVSRFEENANLSRKTLTLQQIAFLFVNHVFVIFELPTFKILNKGDIFFYYFLKETWLSIDVNVKKGILLSDILIDGSGGLEGSALS